MSYRKYGNERHRGYASKKEAQRAADLDLLRRVGAVGEVKEQVPFVLIPKDEMGRAVRYLADFVYDERQNDGSWLPIVEDAKGARTPVYKIKKRLMWHVHKIRIREV